MNYNLGNPNNGSSGSRHTELQALVDILRQLKKPVVAVGSATEAKQDDAILLLTSIDTNVSNLLATQLRANWTVTIGNSIEYTYYAGVEAGNPSGTVTNIKTVVYKQGVTTMWTETIAYNAADLIISTTTS